MTTGLLLTGTFCALVILGYITAVTFLLMGKMKGRPEPLDGVVRAIAADVERLKVASDEQAASVKRVLGREAVTRSRRRKDQEEQPQEEDDDAPMIDMGNGVQVPASRFPDPPPLPWERRS